MPALDLDFLRPRPLRSSARVLIWTSGTAIALVLLGALMLAVSGGHPLFQGLDAAWHAALVSSRTPLLTKVNRVLDFVGNTGMFIYCIALFVVLLIRHRRLAYFVAGANVAAAAATHLLKFTVDRPRPLETLVHVTSASYPSGHVSATVAAMVTTAVVLGRLWIWVSGTILGVAMMYSRMYLAAHWLSDTVAGALLAVGVTLLLWVIVRNKCLAGNTSQLPTPL